MRSLYLIAGLGVAAGTLAGCGNTTSPFSRARPDEFAVSRQQPLIIPPDFALTPPRPGAPRPQEADSSTQALQAMFGGPAPRSVVETGVVNQAGRTDAGARSTAGDPATTVVDKGAVTRDIITAPNSQSPEARASTQQ